MIRGLVVVSVLGACLVAGTVTGTTLALWQDDAPLPAVDLRSGTIGLDVAVLSPGTAPDLYPGSSQVVAMTVSNQSDSGPREQVPMAVSLSAVTGSNAGLDAALRVGARRASGSPCTVDTANVQPVTAFAPAAVIPAGEPLAEGASTTVCLTIGLAPGAPTSLQGAGSTLTLTFTGTQVRR